MLTGRLACALLAMYALAGGTASSAEVGDDGLHKQPWFMDSFLEMGDDLETAAGEGRHLLVLFEQAGCPYCRELHEVNFAQPDIVEYIQENFDVLQLDLWGSREVLDFDGEALEERDIASKWGVSFTPTTIIFAAENAGAVSMENAEAFRLPGFLRPFHYMSSLEYVVEGKYREMGFQRYLQEKFEKRRSQGIESDVW
ncbi:MAG: thioredoxin fold domain-containing protein [Roseovarius sp.]|nr:thioredoxin fold domain-containing protein [Roseovarius sp.]